MSLVTAHKMNSLAAPLSATSSEKRKSSTRLDVITAMLGPPKQMAEGEPRDSLSPLDHIDTSRSMELLKEALSDGE